MRYAQCKIIRGAHAKHACVLAHVAFICNHCVNLHCKLCVLTAYLWMHLHESVIEVPCHTSSHRVMCCQINICDET